MLNDTVVDFPLPEAQRPSVVPTQDLAALYPKTRQVVLGAVQTVTYTVGAYAGLGALGLLLSQLSGSLTFASLMALGYGGVGLVACGRLVASLRAARKPLAAAVPAPIEHEFSGTATRIDLSPAGAGTATHIDLAPAGARTTPPALRPAPRRFR